MNGMFGIVCGDKWLGRWPELALRDLCTQAVGLGYANRWPFGQRCEAFFSVKLGFC